jgi:hypothetical protein
VEARPQRSSAGHANLNGASSQPQMPVPIEGRLPEGQESSNVRLAGDPGGTLLAVYRRLLSLAAVTLNLACADIPR